MPPLSNSLEQRIFALASAIQDAEEPPRLARVALGVRGWSAPPTACAPVAHPSLPDNGRLCRGSPFCLLEPFLHIPRLLPSSWKLSGGGVLTLEKLLSWWRWPEALLGGPTLLASSRTPGAQRSATSSAPSPTSGLRRAGWPQPGRTVLASGPLRWCWCVDSQGPSGVGVGLLGWRSQPGLPSANGNGGLRAPPGLIRSGGSGRASGLGATDP